MYITNQMKCRMWNVNSNLATFGGWPCAARAICPSAGNLTLKLHPQLISAAALRRKMLPFLCSFSSFSSSCFPNLHLLSQFDLICRTELQCFTCLSLLASYLGSEKYFWQNRRNTAAMKRNTVDIIREIQLRRKMQDAWPRRARLRWQLTSNRGCETPVKSGSCYPPKQIRISRL